MIFLKEHFFHAARMAARNLYKTWTLKWLYPGRYRHCIRRQPQQKKKVVFLEVREPALSDNFRLLWQELERQGDWELILCCIREGMEERKKVRKLCLQAIPVLADAAVVFISDSSYFFSSLPLRPQTKVIQTWHACGAFKKFGYSITDKKFGADRKDLERFPLHRNFSIVTVSSPEVVWAYAEAFHMEKEQEKILPVGISRTDIFYRREFLDSAREKLYEKIPEAGGKKVILYAPTFRGRVADAVSPEVLDFSAMREALASEYIVLCKHHPFVKHRPAVPEDCQNFAWDATELFSIEELLAVSDVCISDYSSLVFEYSLFERPMIFLAHDLDEYFDWRGFYYPYCEMAPGPIVSNTAEVIDCIKELPEKFEKERVADFRRKFMSACDGHATERILEAAFGRETLKKRRKK